MLSRRRSRSWEGWRVWGVLVGVDRGRGGSRAGHGGIATIAGGSSALRSHSGTVVLWELVIARRVVSSGGLAVRELGLGHRAFSVIVGAIARRTKGSRRSTRAAHSTSSRLLGAIGVVFEVRLIWSVWRWSV